MANQGDATEMLMLMPGPAAVTVAECQHGIITFDGRGCTVCSIGPWKEEEPQPRPEAKPKKAKAKKDPDLELAAAVASGIICGDCLQPYEPITGRRIGCDCERKATHERNMAVRDYWLSQPEVQAAFAGRDNKRTAIAGMAFTSYNRSARRAAVAPEDREADRLDIIAQHEVDPRWTAVRVNEADTLPV